MFAYDTCKNSQSPHHKHFTLACAESEEKKHKSIQFSFFASEEPANKWIFMISDEHCRPDDGLVAKLHIERDYVFFLWRKLIGVGKLTKIQWNNFECNIWYIFMSFGWFDAVQMKKKEEKTLLSNLRNDARWWRVY